MTAFDHLVYGVLWFGFGAVHSVLAGETAKRRLTPAIGGAYRISNNLFAVVHIALVVYGGQALLAADAVRFAWSSGMNTALLYAQWAGLAVLVGSLTQYNLGLFSGLAQLKQGQADSDNEPLHLSGIHRYVRHPLYAGAYILLWSRVQDEFDLATAIWGSVYLAIGTYFEERSLLRRHGADYANYRAAVPALIPWRGRVI